MTIRLALAACLALLAAPAMAGATEPIEGVWSPVGIPELEVAFHRTGPNTFRATTISGNPPGTCRVGSNGRFNEIGLRGATVSGTGAFYSGTVPYYDTFSCAPIGDGEVVIRLDLSNPATPTMLDCSAPPGHGSPQFDAAGNPIAPTQCDTLRRVRGREAVPRVERMFPFAWTRRRCVERRRIRARFHSPANDPIVVATITVNGRLRHTLRYPNAERAITLLFPRGRWRITIKVTTATGRVLQRTRSFRTCQAD